MLPKRPVTKIIRYTSVIGITVESESRRGPKINSASSSWLELAMVMGALDDDSRTVAVAVARVEARDGGEGEVTKREVDGLDSSSTVTRLNFSSRDSDSDIFAGSQLPLCSWLFAVDTLKVRRFANSQVCTLLVTESEREEKR